MNPPFFQKKPRASALILVLWSIITMSVVVLGVVEYVHYNLDETKGLNFNFELRQIAQSGMAFALSPQIEEDDPILQGSIGDQGGRYEVVLASETARLNINFLLQTGREDILENLFTTWKVPSSEARLVVNDLLDWVGRTGETPENFALERRFTTVEQMRAVPSMEKIDARKPDWPEALTIWGDGKLDINDAATEILQAVFGIGERKALSFVQYRLGPDKLDNTLDDQPYTDMQIIAGALGLTETQFAPYVALLSLETQLTRVESTATLGSRKLQIRSIINRTAQPPIIFQWQEVPL